MSKTLTVAFLSAELDPLAKVGGLADVAYALPEVLQKSGIDIRRFLPFYGSIKKSGTKAELISNNLLMGKELFSLYKWSEDLKVPTYLISHPLFDGEDIYNKDDSNCSRYRFFCQASLVVMEYLKFRPDIVHGNDWHCGLMPSLLKEKEGTFFASVKTLLTIHNLAVQEIDSETGENFLAKGISSYDFVNTVSPSYAKEILTPEYACGLDDVLVSRQDSLLGILNGIDTSLYNPKTDKALAINYRFGIESFKARNKSSLQKELGLPIIPNSPLVAFTARLTSQKGLDLLKDSILSTIIEPGAQMVFLGTGEDRYQEMLLSWAKKYPQNVKTIIGYDADLARRMYAASDFFLMPSVFEPCGLTQMIAMRYGSLPIVRLTGGLKDTVSGAVGFGFKELDSEAFLATIIKALDIYKNKVKIFKKMRKAAFEKNFSVARFSKEYKKLYYRLYGEKK